MIYIDGNAVVSNNFYQGTTQRTGLVDLTPGLHTIDIEYYNGGGGATMFARWDPTGGTNFVDIPNAAFVVPAIDGVIKIGSGTTILSGTNTYTGITTVNGGVLSIGTDANLGAAPSSATPGKILVNGGTLQASGSFTLNSNRGIALGDSLTPSTGGEIDVAAGATLTYAGIVANNAGGGDSLTVGSGANTGTLKVTGAESYTGATTVNDGTLQVDGTLSSQSAVTVGSGGTLSGLGTVGATTVNGILQPGDPTQTGTLHTATLIMPALLKAKEASSVCSEVSVTGTATLTGGTLSLSFADVVATGSTFTIVHTTGGLNGTTFSGLANGSYLTDTSGQEFRINYSTTDVTITKVTATTTSLTSNPVGPITQGTSVTFTATIANANPGSVGTVSFYYNYGLTGQFQIGSAVNVVNGSAMSAATTALPVGSDTITAIYSGGGNFGGSIGTLVIQVVSSAPPPPSVTNVVLNQDITALNSAVTGSAQRSMVQDIVYTFSEPVNIVSNSVDPNLFQINALTVNGVTGVVPATIEWAAVAGSGGTQWEVDFGVNPDATNSQAGALNSIANGCYTITITDFSEITAVSDGQAANINAGPSPGVASSTLPGYVAANANYAQQSFYRLFGDGNGDLVVNPGDIVSLETIEHVDDPELFLRNIKAAAAPDASIVISAPNDYWYYDQGGHNEFHKRKFTFEEFKELTERVLGQARSWSLGTLGIGFSINSRDDALKSGDASAPQELMLEYRDIGAAVYVPSQVESDTTTAEAAFYVGVWGKASMPTSVFAGYPVSMNLGRQALFPRDGVWAIKPDPSMLPTAGDSVIELKQRCAELTQRRAQVEAKLAESIVLVDKQRIEKETLIQDVHELTVRQQELVGLRDALHAQLDSTVENLHFSRKEVERLGMTARAARAEVDAAWRAIGRHEAAARELQAQLARQTEESIELRRNLETEVHAVNVTNGQLAHSLHLANLQLARMPWKIVKLWWMVRKVLPAPLLRLVGRVISTMRRTYAS